MSVDEIRIPGFSAGADLGGEPQSWLVYNKATGERRMEMNPAYVPPPPPTALDLARDAVAEAEWAVRSAQEHLTYVLAELALAEAESASQALSQA